MNITISPLLQGHPLKESDLHYPNIRLNARWRVIVCRDGVQWILQHLHGPETGLKACWDGRSYCRTKEALLRCSRLHCGAIDPVAEAALAALPETIETFPSRLASSSLAFHVGAR